MEENISLYDLLNLSIGTPHRASVNFGALHALLLAVLKQLDIREVKTHWRYTPPGDRAPDTPLGVPVEIQRPPSVSDDLFQPGLELQKPEDWVSAPDGTEGPQCPSVPSGAETQSSAPDGTEGLQCRIQTCEDGTSQALNLIQELQKHKEDLKEKMEEFQQQQQKAAAQQLEKLADVKRCCHRVDALEKAVNSLKENLQRYPGPEELSQCVTLDFVQSVLKDMKPQKEFVTSEVSDRPMLVKPTAPPSTATSSSTTSAAPGSPNISVEDLTSEAAADATNVSSDGSEGGVMAGHHTRTTDPTPDDVATPVLPGSIPKTSGPTPADVFQPQETFGLDRYQETEETVRNIGKLQERFSKLEAHMVALEKQKVDWSELADLRQLNPYKDSQDASNNLTEQLEQHKALIESLMSDHEKNMELLCNVQRAILQLQAECERLQETTRNLDEDNRQKQGHIEELYKTAEELEVKKADKQMVESEIKADKSALESKVSRLQFDVATEQLNSMFHELLNKVTGQEQDWHKVIDRLSTEMEFKLNRIELDCVKMQLEERWRSIHKKLQAQSAPEQDDAAGIRKQLLERFHCLSCDRPIMKQTPGPILVTLPSFPAFPPQKTFRPWTLEQIRQHYRSLTPGSSCCSVWMARSGRRRAQLQKSHADMCRQIESIETQRRLGQKPAGVQHERVSEVTARSCGGNHTNVSSGQRRSGSQHTRLLTQAEGDDVMKEADIVGLDGRIYRGRFNVQELRNTEMKLPLIAPKDGKMKEKTKSSAPQRPAVSPEVGSDTLVYPQPLSAKSMQCSRSASSGSGRDWPVSALGCCTSQSSITQASAADSVADPESCEPLNL
ncbi:glutamine-rich protein 2-like isoform X2 [Girardinichthys multiradiatus]|uniref:glutamine-rich protein 2-like isoform X2 n=1 Tax=Girardinichthys multiradiatus TaxID=208333 RepID=UPI001FABC223|nr:glutamine-rich protein 2-like isoform X2 [Girardinichthys multiradiatus]